jgi:two-component system cell cycle sensor histidine kinase/response regulator CckA
MIPIILFLLSIGLQLAAALYAALLIRITGRKLAWSLISISMLLMTWHRVISLISLLTAGKKVVFDIAELIALVVSCLMLLGVLLIGEYFRSITVAETERRRAEEKLSIRENELRTIIDSEPECVKMIAEDGSLLQMNPAGLAMMGAESLEQIQGRCIYPMIEPEYRQQFQEANKDVFKGESRKLEFKMTGLKGASIWLESHAVPLRGADGKIIAQLAVTRDITRRKLAEEALRQSELRYRNLIENARDIIFTISADQTITSLNPAFETITGWSRADFIGEDVRQIICPDDLPLASKILAKVLRGETPRMFELRVCSKPGGYVVGEFMTTPQIENGKVVGILGIARDMTYHKKLEEQLLQAQKMEAVGQLAGGVAHYFNNILTTILGYGEFLQEHIEAGSPLRNYVDIIRTSANRASNLTHNLLAFSRKQIINPRPVKLNDIVTRVERLLSRLIGEDIELKTALSAKDVIVRADPFQIEQVLMNLATNARDSMPEGGLLIIETGNVELDEDFMRTHAYGEPGPYALLSVSDAGIGMDEETRKRVFEPFFTTKEVGKGTGLGLSMVYGIVKQHEGFIDVYSEPGKGTTFKIYLPATALEAEETTVESRPVLGGEETILVAEDDETVRRLTSDQLRKFGYTVITAENGEDAIEKFMVNREKIHLLLLDVIMPKKNGKEVYTEIKKITPGIKALFLSGYPADLIHRRGILEEGLHFVPKPVSTSDLLRKVREVLDS